LKVEHGLANKSNDKDAASMENLLAKLSEQQALLEHQKNQHTFLGQQKNTLASIENIRSEPEREVSLSGSVPLTPATASFNDTPNTSDSDAEKTTTLNPAEILRLKKELDAAKDQIARQEQELSKTRNIKHTMEQAKGPFATMNTTSKSDAIDRTISNVQAAYNASKSSAGPRQDVYGAHDDSRSDISEALSAGHFNRNQNAWSANTGPGYNAPLENLSQPYQQPANIWGQGNRPWMNRPMAPALAPLMVSQQQHMQQRAYSGPTSPISGGPGRFGGEYNAWHGAPGLRRSNTQNNRSGSGYAHGRNNAWEQYGGSNDGSVMNMTPMSSFQPMGMFQAPLSYQPRPIGTPLSPTAAEFTSATGVINPWNSAVSLLNRPLRKANWLSQTPASPGQTYVSPVEPLNYRRLLDRSVTCNWKYIVDKIVCNNDQQASIFLQQKLKVGTAEQKFEIVEAIVSQAYPLMVNRFGNFLVQRCFEHGTPEQVVAIANAIRGNTLSLSMDAFGCHVVQKAFDAVPEDYKAIMVHELLRRIPETVIHRYACHVWQKLFELRWSDSPPQIMKYVNEALRGMWHEVALGETGSLVVQNIFENCLEEDKVSSGTSLLDYPR
jgi:hypothetical protein